MIIFLGLHGTLPGPENKIAFPIALHPQKVEPWIRMLNRIVETVDISRKELKSVSGGLSFFQTSVFG